MKCYACGKLGHISRDCTAPNGGPLSTAGKTCYRCGQAGMFFLSGCCFFLVWIIFRCTPITGHEKISTQNFGNGNDRY
ncbi:hypothetical protein FPQ18DRAFT_314450 [Pyronema domesticum]|nr:hypothetical protein FPQ18DRAFT_314450 [Pyronema domesticum]